MMRTDISVLAGSRYTTPSSSDKGFLELQPQAIGRGVDGSATFGFGRHSYGFIGLPNDPDVDKSDPTKPQIKNGAHLLFFYEGNTLHALSLDDPRVNAQLPQVPKGGSLHYGASAAGKAPSWSRHDGQGNYDIQVPAGSKVTITVDGGVPIVVDDTTVKIGNDPVPLALGDALNKVIQQVATLMGTPAANGSPPATPAQVTTFLQSVADYETNTLEGT